MARVSSLIVLEVWFGWAGLGWFESSGGLACGLAGLEDMPWDIVEDSDADDDGGDDPGGGGAGGGSRGLSRGDADRGDCDRVALDDFLDDPPLWRRRFVGRCHGRSRRWRRQEGFVAWGCRSWRL